MDEDHVGDNGDGQVPEMLGEDGADKDVTQEGAWIALLDEVDVGEETGGGDDDDDARSQVARGEAKDESVAKLAASSIQDVGQDDGEGTDKGETADDHVDRVAGGTDAFALKGGGVIGIGIGAVVGGNEADGRMVIVKPPGMGLVE